MDTFSFWDYSIDNATRSTEFFSNKYSHSDLLINTADKRFKIKSSHSHYPNLDYSLKPPQNAHIQYQHQSSANDLLKLNLNNKKELKKKLLNFDINRNFEDIYWLSLKEGKQTKNGNQNFPPIFDKNFFKPKHGMNNYQLIKFENRYHQQLLLQQQQQQQQQSQPLSNKSSSELIKFFLLKKS
jgi:hypothetical protein